MRHLAVVLVAIVVVSIAWIGFRFDFEDSASPSVTDEPAPSVPAIVDAEGLPSTALSDAAPILPSAQAANDVAFEEGLVSDLTTNIYARLNSPFVRFLVNRGLSTQDSERVIGEAFRDAAICWFTAVRAQAQAEGRSFDFASELQNGALSDSRILNQLPASCINSALERVGVNPPMGIKANDG